jgi:hypothetical protein
MKALFVAALMVLSLSATALAQSIIPALPKEMIGTWGFEDAESCAKGSDTQMTARAKEVEFFASAYRLQKISRQADGTVKGAGTRTEEGEPGRWRATIKLKLVSGDRLSVTTGRDEPMIYVRCKS